MEHNPYLQSLCQNKKGSMNRGKWTFSLKKEVCLSKWDFRDHTFKRIEMESWMRMSSGAKIPTKTGSQIYPSVSICYYSRKESRWWATAVESAVFDQTGPTSQGVCISDYQNNYYLKLALANYCVLLVI